MRLLLTWFLFSPFASAVESPVKARLFEVAKERYIYFLGQPRPNRVHAVYEPKTKKWLLRLSGGKGEFAPEILVPGSVFSGRFLGGDDGQNYLLLPDGRWMPTKEAQEHRFQIESGLASYRVFVPR